MKSRPYKIVNCRIEESYGVKRYIQILKTEIAALNELIQRSNLDKTAFVKAKKLIPMTLKVTSSDVENKELNWCRDWKTKYTQCESPDMLNPVSAFLERLKELTQKICSLLIGETLIFFNGRKMNSANSFKNMIQNIESDVIIPGIRVPMISQYHSSVNLKGASLVIKKGDLKLIDIVEDIQLKFSLKKVLIQGKWGFQQYQPIAKKAQAVRLKGSKEKKLPKISLVIVSLNQKEFLEECIFSVLGQDYENLELILVDGGSNDGSLEIIKKHKKAFCHIISEDDRGQSHALNKGFSLSSGDVLGWLCSDDKLEKNALRTMGSIFAETNADIAVGGCRVIDQNGSTKTIHYSGFVTNKISPFSFGDCLAFTGNWQKSLFFYQPEVFFGRKIWERSGGFIREELYYAMDYELFLRFALAGATLYATREIVGCSRQHPSQKTKHEIPNYLPTVQQILLYYHNLFVHLPQGERNTAISE